MDFVVKFGDNTIFNIEANSNNYDGFIKKKFILCIYAVLK